MKKTLGHMKCGEETFLYFFSPLQGKTVPSSTLNMAYRLKYSFLVATTFLLNINLCYCICARAEYEINGECCPMCAPGTRVYRHCTEYTSTTCVPCVDATFTPEPNGLPNCFICAMCDPGQGLKVKTACTQISNTVCGPLEGFYCTNIEKSSCTQAVEHTKCSPGQYIKQKGTAHKDAECAGCKNGTYSDGSQEICKQHTKCEDLGLTEIKPGTTMSDVECGSKIQVALIAGIIIAIVMLAVALVILLKMRHKFGKHAVRNPETETGEKTGEAGSERPHSPGEDSSYPVSSSRTAHHEHTTVPG